MCKIFNGIQNVILFYLDVIKKKEFSPKHYASRADQFRFRKASASSSIATNSYRRSQHIREV